MKKLSRRDMLRSGIIGAMGLFFTSILPSKSSAHNKELFTDVSSEKNSVQYTQNDPIITPEMAGITKRLEIPPKNGWKEQTYYIVDAAFSEGNPIHRRIYLHGFNKWGKVNNFNRVVSGFPDSAHGYQIKDWYYIKAICEIDVYYNLK
jgi:hypothetical protein